MKVLVVDDEALITLNLETALAMVGHEVRVARDAEGLLAQARVWRPDIIVLDVVMPGKMNGLDALRFLRRESDVPVILMSALGQDHDKVLGLEYADDYLVKPFSSAELVARIRAVLRRADPRPQEASAGTIHAGELTIDQDACQAHYAGRPLSLTPTEYRILCLLAAHPGRVFSRDHLMERIWGHSAYVDPHALDVHIRGLRSKLEPDPARPLHVVTVRGMGFRYAP